MNVSSITTCFTGAPALQDEATVLADYEVGQRLGEGAYGSVYVAKYIPSGEHFALKILQKDMLFSPLTPHDSMATTTAAATAAAGGGSVPAVAMPVPLHEQQQLPHHVFLSSSSPLGEAHLPQTVAQAVELQIVQEATVMQALEHPHVVKFYKFLSSTTAFYLIMELVDGGELFDLIISKHYFAEDEARMYFQQLISAIDYCHSNGVAHKDLKAENLLLGSDHRLLVCDFGFSAKNATHNLDDPEQTLCTGDNVALLRNLYAGAAFGTLHYMSPEAVLASMQNEYTTSLDNPSVRSAASPLLTQSPLESHFAPLAEHNNNNNSGGGAATTTTTRPDVTTPTLALSSSSAAAAAGHVTHEHGHMTHNTHNKTLSTQTHDGGTATAAAASARRAGMTTSASSGALDAHYGGGSSNNSSSSQQLHDHSTVTVSSPRHGGANNNNNNNGHHHNKAGKHGGEGGGGGLTAIVKSLIGGNGSSSSHHHHNHPAQQQQHALRKSASSDALMEQSTLRRHVTAWYDAVSTTAADGPRGSASDRSSPLLPHDKQRRTFANASPPPPPVSPLPQPHKQTRTTAAAVGGGGDASGRHTRTTTAAATPTTTTAQHNNNNSTSASVASPLYGAPSMAGAAAATTTTATTTTATAASTSSLSTRPKHVIVDPFQQDLWSAGVILFFMLTGRLPFDGRDDEETLQLIQHNQYAFTSDEVRRISPEARALVAQMLAAEPMERPTLDQLLHNRWFAQDLNVEVDFSHREGLAEALAAEGLLVRRSSTFLNFSTQHAVTANEERVLEKAFRKIDTDGYGVITREQIRDMLTTLHGDMVSKEDVAELVGLLTGDANADVITFEQFRAAWVTRDLAHAPYSHRSEFQLANIVATQMDEVEREVVRLLRAAFNSVDDSQSGVIQLAQLRRVFERCHMDVHEDDLCSLMRFFYEQVTQHRCSAAGSVSSCASAGATTSTAAAAAASERDRGDAAKRKPSDADDNKSAQQHHRSSSVSGGGKSSDRSVSGGNGSSSAAGGGGSDKSAHASTAAAAAASSSSTSASASSQLLHSPTNATLHTAANNNSSSSSSTCDSHTQHTSCESVPISFDTFVIGIVQRDILLRHPMGRKLAAATNLAALFHSRNITHAVHHGFLVVGLQQVVLDKLTSVPERLRLLYSDEVVSQTENIYSFRYLGSTALQQGTTLVTAEPLLAAEPLVTVALAHSQPRGQQPQASGATGVLADTTAAASSSLSSSLCRRTSTAASLLLVARATRHQQQRNSAAVAHANITRSDNSNSKDATAAATVATAAKPATATCKTTKTTAAAASPRAHDKRETTAGGNGSSSSSSNSVHYASPLRHHHHHHTQPQQQSHGVGGSAASKAANATTAASNAPRAQRTSTSSAATATTTTATAKKASAAGETTHATTTGTSTSSAAAHDRRGSAAVTTTTASSTPQTTTLQLPDVLVTTAQATTTTGEARSDHVDGNAVAAADGNKTTAATAVAGDASSMPPQQSQPQQQMTSPSSLTHVASDAVGVSPSGTFFPHRAMAYGGAGAVQLVSGVCDVDLILSPACLGYTLVRFRRIHGKTNDFHEAVAYISSLLEVERQQAIEDTMVTGESELM